MMMLTTTLLMNSCYQLMIVHSNVLLRLKHKNTKPTRIRSPDFVSHEMRSSLAFITFAFAFIIINTSISINIVQSKTYLRCELARKLLERHNFDRSLLSNWICLLEHESGLDTTKITRNPNGTRNIGLFQINSRYCMDDRRGGGCNVKCGDLLDDNLREAAACARRVQAEEGFQYWNGWQRYCRNPRNLPNLKVICGI